MNRARLSCLKKDLVANEVVRGKLSIEQGIPRVMASAIKTRDLIAVILATSEQNGFMRFEPKPLENAIRLFIELNRTASKLSTRPQLHQIQLSAD